MSYSVLARRSKVSMATVVRILSGKHPEASFASVSRIAEALGSERTFRWRSRESAFKEEQAKRKAESLARMAQATSGLEGQAVSRETVEEMKSQIVHELLAGSSRRLWGD